MANNKYRIGALSKNPRRGAKYSAATLGNQQAGSVAAIGDAQ